MMLTYIPKRIHFSTNIFKMRMNLAVLDWVTYNIISYTHHMYYHDYLILRMRMCIGRTPVNGWWLISGDQIATQP